MQLELGSQSPNYTSLYVHSNVSFLGCLKQVPYVTFMIGRFEMRLFFMMQKPAAEPPRLASEGGARSVCEEVPCLVKLLISYTIVACHCTSMFITTYDLLW